jgi:hypothetical protein
VERAWRDMALSEECLTRWIQLADSGDPDAQVVMAWEYVEGEAVPKDLGRAVGLSGGGAFQRKVGAIQFGESVDQERRCIIQQRDTTGLRFRIWPRSLSHGRRCATGKTRRSRHWESC